MVNLTKPVNLTEHDMPSYTPEHIAYEPLPPTPKKEYTPVHAAFEVIPAADARCISIQSKKPNAAIGSLNAIATIAVPKVHIPRKFIRRVIRRSREMSSEVNELLSQLLIPGTLITLLAFGTFVSILLSAGYVDAARDFTIFGIISTLALPIANGVLDLIQYSRLSFFKFQGNFKELKTYLKLNHPNHKMCPTTMVLRNPSKRVVFNKDDRDINAINEKYLSEQHSFLVAIDVNGYIYVDAAAPYGDDLTDFYQNNS